MERSLLDEANARLSKDRKLAIWNRDIERLSRASRLDFFHIFLVSTFLMGDDLAQIGYRGNRAVKSSDLILSGLLRSVTRKPVN